jgi:hypothetical protein
MPIRSDFSDFPLANSCGNGTYVFEISWTCVSRFPHRGPTNAAMESDNCVSAVDVICCALDNYYMVLSTCRNIVATRLVMVLHLQNSLMIKFHFSTTGRNSKDFLSIIWPDPWYSLHTWYKHGRLVWSPCRRIWCTILWIFSKLFIFVLHPWLTIHDSYYDMRRDFRSNDRSTIVHF